MLPFKITLCKIAETDNIRSRDDCRFCVLHRARLENKSTLDPRSIGQTRHEANLSRTVGEESTASGKPAVREGVRREALRISR
jgi:hypothetical protein